MRILLVSDSASPHTGGLNRAVVETCGLLTGAGHEVGLVYHDSHPVEVGCRTFHLPASQPVKEWCEGLFRVVGEWRADVVQSHSFQSIPALATLSERTPTCAFFHDLSWICSGPDRMTRDFEYCHRPHGISCLAWHYLQGCGGKNPLGNLRRWNQVEQRTALRNSRRIRFQFASEFMRQAYLENGFASDQTDLVPLFAIPSKAGLESNFVEPGLVLLPSRLVVAKGVQVAIEALSLIRSVPWRLVIAGTGPILQDLRAQSERLGVADRVVFLGEISPRQLDDWYRRAQLVLFPVLRHEPFGLIGPETMAHGKPVVAFAGGAVGEWLRHGETGLMVAKKTAVDFAAAVEGLLRDEALCRRMGAEALRHFAPFHPDRYLSNLLSSFEKTRTWFADAG